MLLFLGAFFLIKETLVYQRRAQRTHPPQGYLGKQNYSETLSYYIINFKPDRFPLGDPKNLKDESKTPTLERLTNNTFCTLADEDAGPTKAWIVTNRNRPDVKPFFNNAYGKRPKEELYDLKADPYQLTNVASHRDYSNVKKTLKDKLLSTLTETKDPRMVNDGEYFEIILNK